MTDLHFSRRAGLAAAIGAIAFVANRAFGQQPHPPAVPPAVIHERERILNDAEVKLREAHDLLFRAGHDYAGHRLAALRMIDGALGEVSAARRFLV